MKKSIKRTVTIMLLLSMLVSCGTAVQETETETTVAETVTETVPDGPVFAELTYDGDEFCFLTEDWRFGDIYDSVEIYSEGMDGTLINDAVYTRNQMVEERFDIHITEEKLPLAHEVAYNTILAGDSTHDVVMPYLNSSTTNALEGLYEDLHTLEHLKLENSWWDQNANATLQIHNKLYFTTGDISILDNDCMLVLFFNKDIIAEFQMDNPYELVKEGTWTFDAMQEMCDIFIADLNGDGVMKEADDRFGIYIAGNTPHALFFAAGERIVYPDADGTQQLVMYNERSVDAVTRIMEFSLDKRHMNGDYKVSINALMEKRLLFGGWALTEIDSLRESESDFGILPYPKFDEAQESYHCIISTGLTPAVSVPITNQNLEQAGLILEAMAYYSVDTLTHAYYDMQLNSRYIRDEESSEMFDIMFASSVYDFGFIFNIGGLGGMIEGMYQGKQKNFASNYARLEKMALSDLEKIFASPDEN